MSDKDFTRRINRIIGQLEALKRLADSEADCLKVLQQLKASVQGLKKAGESYVGSHLDQCLTHKQKQSEVKEKVRQVVAASFYL